ncbi:MAG: protein kinase domain-containing protein [Limisphaerales bacterium]
MSKSQSVMALLQKNEEALFALALEKPLDKRRAFLDAVCEGDPALRERLESLLVTHDAPASKITMKLDLPDAPDEAVGQTLGRYKLLGKFGEGGSGMVYVAEQIEPVRRRVALKVIKLGMDTKAVVARFEAERQALAMMDHPNIAKVLDAGTTEQGRPFFVMELVRGIRITDYCDQNKLSTKERLNLFIKVCQAIQHAHQKGIIHRDIKPSNILVTLHDGMPVPKVIDFGIAKATEGRLTDAKVYTQLQQFIGTPAYMSPEQAEMSGLDIDTRSDIYSLGVLLYELLAGSTPFDAKELMALGIDAMRKTIREKEPVRPSTRFAMLKGEELTTVAKRRSADASKLLHQLRGDLDWIVMKCLEKDRTRRYETANGLAADLKRHLNNEPVVARPPSQLYRLQKMVGRHKLTFGMMLVVMLALLLGVIGTTIGFQRSEKQRQLAEASQRRARENFDQARAAVGDLLAVADDDLWEVPGMQPLRVKLMRAALDRYQHFLEQPSADPVLRAELGRLYLRYGFNSKEVGADYNKVVIPAYNSALAIQQQLVREQPENRSFRADLGYTIIYSKLWWNDVSGVKVYQPQAIATFEGLVRENPEDPFARSGLVWALGLDVAGVLPDDPEKMAKSERRLALLEQLVKEYPLSAEFRRDLANQLAWYPSAGEGASDHVTELARVSRANELRAAVIAGLEQHDPAVLAPLHPRDSEAQLLRPSLLWAKIDLANGWQRQSLVLAQLKRWPEAVSFADRSTALARDLLEQNPSVKFLAALLDSSFTNWVQVAEQAGDVAGAQAHRLEADNFWRSHPSIDRAGK